jgi:quercetin dioxygenase-like cupin family protein
VNRDDLERLWHSRSFSFELWRDPPGQEWEDFSHESDELIYVLEGQIEVEVEGEKRRLGTDEETFIPANTVHTIRNIGDRVALWLYGCRTNA